MHYNIALIGFGGVNRALADIIATDPDRFYCEMGFNLRIVAVSDMFLGSVYSPEGIDLDYRCCSNLESSPPNTGSPVLGGI